MSNHTYDLTIQAHCPLRAGPCLAGFAFMARLGQCCAMAARANGAPMAMSGAVTLESCAAQSACALDWQVDAGAMELSRAGRVLLRGHLAQAAMQ
jgi:hypothetical protein